MDTSVETGARLRYTGKEVPSDLGRCVGRLEGAQLITSGTYLASLAAGKTPKTAMGLAAAFAAVHCARTLYDEEQIGYCKLPVPRRADIIPTNHSDAAATRIAVETGADGSRRRRGPGSVETSADGSRRRQGRDVNSPWTTGRGVAKAAT